MRQKETMQNPWAGLSSYEDPAKSSQKLKFCGRDSETFDVSRLIDDNFFVTLYGKSGIGKTSLLNAGVFPALRRKQYTPLSLRLGMSDESQCFQDIITTAIERAVEEAGGSTRVIPVVKEQTDRSAVDYLWNWFARRQFLTAEGQTTFPVVVFDQFEEVFRQFDSRDKAEVLLAQIHYLIDETHALGDCIVEGEEYSYDFNFRFVLSIREDDLYRLEDSIDNCALTALKRCRYRLRSLSEQGARAAILLPGEGLFRAEEQDQIVQTIIGIARNKEDQNISTNLLSLVCNRIFVEFQKKPDADFISRSLVETFVKGNLFERFYDEATKGFSNREKSYIEEHLVDSTGRRNSIPESDFLLHVPNGTKLLEGDTRILQRSSVSTDGGNYRIELIHDSFCEPLSRQREKREKRRRVRMMLVAAGVALLCAGIAAIILIQKDTIAQKDFKLWQEVKQLELTTKQLYAEKDSVQLKAKQLAEALNQIDEKNRALQKEKDFALLKARQLAEALDQIDEKNQELERTILTLKENKSMYLAEKAKELAQNGDSYLARMIALEALDLSNTPEGETAMRASLAKDCALLCGSESDIFFASYSPNGKYIVSASDSTLRLWDALTGGFLRELNGHSSNINFATFSPDGKYIASTSWDETIHVWDVSTGRSIKTLQGHTGSTYKAFFSPDGKRLFSTSADGTVRIWNISSGMCIDTIQHEAPVSAALTPDGKKLVSISSMPVISVSYAPDGRKFYSASEKSYGLRIWDLTTKRCSATIPGISGNVYPSSFSPEGKRIALVIDEVFILVLDASTGQQQMMWQGHDDEITSVLFSPDGKRIASTSADHTLRIWDAYTGKLLNDLDGHSDWVTDASFSPDGSLIASSSWDNTMRIWNTYTGECCQILSGHLEEISSVEFSNDGKHLLSASKDHTIRIWDVNPTRNSKVLQQCNHSVESVAFSPDGKYVVSGSLDSIIRISDVVTGECVRTIRGSADGVSSVVFSPDGKTVVSVSMDDIIRVWDISNGSCLNTLFKDYSSIEYAIVSPDGKFILASSNYDNLHIWDATTGQYLKSIAMESAGGFNSAFYSYDGKSLVTASNDNTVRLWDVVNGKCIREMKGHNGIVDDVIFSPDGKLVISASWDNTLRVWDVASGQCVNVFRGHTGWVTAAAFSPDGKYVASSSWDQTVRVWDVSSGVCLQVLEGHTDIVNDVAFSPDGRRIVSAANDQTVRIWNFPPLQELIDETRKRFKDRQLTPEERKKYYLE